MKPALVILLSLAPGFDLIRITWRGHVVMRQSDKRITMLSADSFAIGYWLIGVLILVFKSL